MIHIYFSYFIGTWISTLQLRNEWLSVVSSLVFVLFSTVCEFGFQFVAVLLIPFLILFEKA